MYKKHCPNFLDGRNEGKLILMRRVYNKCICGIIKVRALIYWENVRMFRFVFRLEIFVLT